MANALAYYDTATIPAVKMLFFSGRGAVFSKLYFLRNLRIGPISKSVTLQLAGNACQGQTYWTHLKVTKILKCCEYGPRPLLVHFVSCLVTEYITGRHTLIKTVPVINLTQYPTQISVLENEDGDV